MSSAPTITFEVRPSRILAFAVGLMALLAVVAVVLARLPLAARVLLGVAIAAYAIHQLRRLHRTPLTAVGWHADDTWTLHLTGGRQVRGRLASGRVLGPLIVLRLAWPRGGETALTLLPDSVDADTRRRLRVRLSANADKR